MTEATLNKLRILAESAKYDVSCSSSGTVRRGRKGDGIGNTSPKRTDTVSTSLLTPSFRYAEAVLP